MLALQRGYDKIACICFVNGILYKQMSLYYAPAVGCYLLAKCISFEGYRG
jgi:alpha-1,3-glucosyltransferase